ncbi:NADP-dependent oxidoreductase domain-containing protein [Armillaria mellea]|nr:NADP-dependent oxidoreductase domain-containing protein [Armillaria mellea]
MYAKAEYRRLGNSGLRVSVPVLGAMAFGSPQWLKFMQLTALQGLAILKAAWDVGINTVDTANAYSNGESENIIGNFIVKYKIPRENLVIMTKALVLVSKEISGFPAFDPILPNTRDYVNQGGLSRTALFNQVEASLGRLKTSYIDVLQIHAGDPTMPYEETMKALHDLVVSGKVRYIGACNLKAWQFAEMNHIAEIKGWTQFVSMQVEHSLLYRTEEQEMFAYCKYKGIGVLSYSPLMGGGRLARLPNTSTPRSDNVRNSPFEKKVRPSDTEIIKRVQQLASKHGWKMSDVALAWSVTKVSSPIVGANSVQRVNEAVVSGKSITEDEMKYLEELYVFLFSRQIVPHANWS